jgi:hypothetical protein
MSMSVAVSFSHPVVGGLEHILRESSEKMKGLPRNISM